MTSTAEHDTQIQSRYQSNNSRYEDCTCWMSREVEPVSEEGATTSTPEPLLSVHGRPTFPSIAFRKLVYVLSLSGGTVHLS